MGADYQGITWIAGDWNEIFPFKGVPGEEIFSGTRKKMFNS
jgi:hypothetical protein